MKKNQMLFSTVFCGVVLALTVSTPVRADEQGLATVARIQGEARYSLGDGNWHPLVVGKTLHAGAVIQTGQDASVDVVLGDAGVPMPQAISQPNKISPAPDFNVRSYISYRPSVEQNTVRMSSDTTLAIDKLTVSDTGVDTVSDTELDLRQGRIFNSVKKLSSASQYIVKIPNGVAGVRGTEFTISADDSVFVLKGSVVISIVGPSGNPVTTVVNQGNGFNPRTGQIFPLSAGEIRDLTWVAIVSHTLYQRVVSFVNDLTTVYISPTTGYVVAQPL